MNPFLTVLLPTPNLLLPALLAGAGLAAFAAPPATAADRWDWSQRLPEVTWRAEIGAGFASVALHEDRVVAFGNLSLVEDRLLILTARGELVTVLPRPDGYRETGRVQVLGGESWTAPRVAGSRVFARNKQGTLVRVDLP